MGNDYIQACKSGDDEKFRGEGDIPLTNIINSLTDEEFTKFCKAGEDAGVLDAEEYPTKFDMIERLEEINDDLK
jgi:hypothetical protein